MKITQQDFMSYEKLSSAMEHRAAAKSGYKRLVRKNHLIQVFISGALVFSYAPRYIEIVRLDANPDGRQSSVINACLPYGVSIVNGRVVREWAKRDMGIRYFNGLLLKYSGEQHPMQSMIQNYALRVLDNNSARTAEECRLCDASIGSSANTYANNHILGHIHEAQYVPVLNIVAARENPHLAMHDALIKYLENRLIR